MEENTKAVESLLEKAAEYGKTSFELVKLRALDKTSDVVSSLIPQLVVCVFVLSFFLFLSLGLAFWLGEELLGKTYFGLLAVAAIYGITGLFVHLFMHKWLKKLISNHFIKQVLK